MKRQRLPGTQRGNRSGHDHPDRSLPNLRHEGRGGRTGPHRLDSVCPNCKEDYVQRLREGAPLGTQQWRYGGFWIRFAAYFIDYVILQLVNVVLLVGMFAVMAASGGGDESASGPNFVIVLFYLLMFATAFFYYVVPTGHPKMQGTLGKRIVGCGSSGRTARTWATDSPLAACLPTASSPGSPWALA
jgi:hypothetical protein